MKPATKLNVFLISINPHAGQLWKEYLDLRNDDELYHWKNCVDALNNFHSIYPCIVILDRYFSREKAFHHNVGHFLDEVSGFPHKPVIFYISPHFSVDPSDHHLLEKKWYTGSNMNSSILNMINRKITELRGPDSAVANRLVA